MQGHTRTENEDQHESTLPSKGYNVLSQTLKSTFMISPCQTDHLGALIHYSVRQTHTQKQHTLTLLLKL